MGWHPSHGESEDTVSSTDVFERLSGRYDAWYASPAARAVFAAEVACLRPLLRPYGRPRLEVGVATGRFAAALDVDIGVDPALTLARARGVRVLRAAGQHLPFRSGVFPAVLLVVTLCFTDDPAAVLAEARRVLRPDGALVLGLVFADSPWASFYRWKAGAGHPFYSAAHFLPRDYVATLLDRSGLRLTAARSTLHQRPADIPVPEPAYDGEADTAGFIGWRAEPADM